VVFAVAEGVSEPMLVSLSLFARRIAHVPRTLAKPRYSLPGARPRCAGGLPIPAPTRFDSERSCRAEKRSLAVVKARVPVGAG